MDSCGEEPVESIWNFKGADYSQLHGLVKDGVRSSVTREDLGVELLLLHIE